MNRLEDFVILSLLLEPEEREKIFAELGPQKTETALEAMIAFAYLGVEGDQPRFEERIEHGVLQGANLGRFAESVGRATEANASISVEYQPDLENLRQRLEQGKDLTDSEIGALVREGEIDLDELEKLARSERLTPGVSI